MPVGMPNLARVSGRGSVSLMAYSATREPPNTTWVWQSIKPGQMTLPWALMCWTSSMPSTYLSTSALGPMALMRLRWLSVRW